MKKKTMKAQEQNLEKMDPMSRRKFIKNIGFALTALSVPTLVRLETMEKISKKLLGSSLAFAQEANQDFFFIVTSRGGHPFTSVIGNQTDHTPHHVERNTQSSHHIFQNSATNNGVAINIPQYDGADSNPLNAHRHSIQACSTFMPTQGHRSAFAMAGLAGGQAGNPLIWASEQKQSETLGNIVAFHRGPDGDETMNLPANKAAHHPEFHSINSVVNKYKELEITNRQGDPVIAEKRNALFQALNNRFQQDVEKAIRANDKKGSINNFNEKALAALKEDYSNLLDPNSGDNTAVRNHMDTSMAAPGKIDGDGSGVMHRAFITAMRLMENGITPNYALWNNNGGDWHNNRDYAGDLSNGDTNVTINGAGTPQGESAIYIAEALNNMLTSADFFTGGGFTPTIHVIFMTEFIRNQYHNSSSFDNPDGGAGGLIYASSDPAFTGFKSGSFGGTSSESRQVLYSNGSNTPSSSGSLYSRDQMMRHLCDILKIDMAQTDMGELPDVPDLKA
jgi:hypothetical protein